MGTKKKDAKNRLRARKEGNRAPVLLHFTFEAYKFFMQNWRTLLQTTKGKLILLH
jgi:hypothetical protein